MGDEYNHLGEECKSSKQEKERKFVWVGDQNFAHSRFCIESCFYMEFSGQQWSSECGSLKEVVVDMFGCCLEL
jgi:hypothetical protein